MDTTVSVLGLEFLAISHNPDMNLAVNTRSDEAAFHAELQGEDVLGVVVRAHIRVELCLNELIEALGADPRHVDKMNLDFAQRVHLALALGLSDSYSSALLAMGALRNKFAHQADARLGKQEINNLYKSLSSDDRNVVVQAYERTKKQLGREEMPVFRKLDPKDQLVFIAIGLRAALDIAIRQSSRSTNLNRGQV